MRSSTYSVVAVGLTLIGLTSVALAQNGRPGSDDGGSPGRMLLSDQDMVVEGEPISFGHVVVGGDYLKPPYRLTLHGAQVLINSVPVATLQPNGWGGVKSRPAEFVARLERSLHRGATIVVFDDTTYLVVDAIDTRDFWKSLLGATSVEQQVQIVFEQADFDKFGMYCIPTAQWRNALVHFAPTETLIEFIATETTSELRRCRRDEHELEIETQSPSDSAYQMYLLNTSGMLLAVISLGTLLNNRPTRNVAWIQIVRSVDAANLVRKCLSLSVMLSLFDLINTLAADSVGGFVEGNPLAANLLDNPYLLIVAKLGGTVLSVGLLWYRRHYAGAQQASWWICFVLTLVTVRWVVVDSLFYV